MFSLKFDLGGGGAYMHGSSKVTSRQEKNLAVDPLHLRVRPAFLFVRDAASVVRLTTPRAEKTIDVLPAGGSVVNGLLRGRPFQLSSRREGRIRRLAPRVRP